MSKNFKILTLTLIVAVVSADLSTLNEKIKQRVLEDESQVAIMETALAYVTSESCSAFCQSADAGDGSIIGTAPFCGGNCQEDCSGTHCTIATSNWVDYGSECRTGNKICCCGISAVSQINDVCITKNHWSKDLTFNNLKYMINTVTGKNWGSVYIFVPGVCPNTNDRGRLYKSTDKKLHAEDNMVRDCGLTNEFYLTSSPCPHCAMMLIQKYRHQFSKPTIYIARLYFGKGKGNTKCVSRNRACLAMLVKAGFTLLPWDWANFSKYLNDAKCIKSITDNKDALAKRYNKMVEELKNIKKLKGNLQDFTNVCNQA